jgi:hypothetical protein
MLAIFQSNIFKVLLVAFSMLVGVLVLASVIAVIAVRQRAEKAALFEREAADKWHTFRDKYSKFLSKLLCAFLLSLLLASC